jgi:hypothetical protein
VRRSAPIILAILLTASTAFAQGKSLRDQLPIEARGHWDAGVALAGRGDAASWAAARTSFYEAYKLSHNPRVLFNVAVCEKNSLHYDKAYSTIQRELDEGKVASPQLSAGEVNEANSFMKGLEAFVARINITIDQKDADIYVNDEKIDNSKLPGPYLVSSGPIKVRATKAGFGEAVQNTELAGGKTGDITLKMQATERTTTVNINVIGPPFATVKVDNQVVGQTPFSGPIKVQDTPHQISIEAPGYVTGIQTVTVKEGPPINLTMTLAAEQVKGKLLINAIPEGAVIEIDGAIMGATRWEGPVDAKLHQVSVKKQGYYTWTQDVDVPKGGQREVTARLDADRNNSFLPWLIGSVVVGTAVIVGIVLLATPPDEPAKAGNLAPFTHPTGASKHFTSMPMTPGFHF